MKIEPVQLLVRYAGSFYQLLGNRRKFERLSTSEAIRVTCHGYALDTTHVCSIVDISPRGIAIDCPEQIVPETIVQLESGDGCTSRLARVRHCQQRGTGFR